MKKILSIFILLVFLLNNSTLSSYSMLPSMGLNLPKDQDVQWLESVLEEKSKENPKSIDETLEIFKNDPTSENWPSWRISYEIFEGLLKLFNPGVTKRNLANIFVYDVKKVMSFYEDIQFNFLDLAIYDVILNYHSMHRHLPQNVHLNIQDMGNDEYLEEGSRVVHHCLKNRGSSNPNRGQKNSVHSTCSNDKIIKTINCHGLDNNQIYPMIIEQYSRAIKNNNLQTLNVIVGIGNNSTTNYFSVTAVLVMAFCCKNNLEAVVLPSNIGMISFRLHRKNEPTKKITVGPIIEIPNSKNKEPLKVDCNNINITSIQEVNIVQKTKKNTSPTLSIINSKSKSQYTSPQEPSFNTSEEWIENSSNSNKEVPVNINTASAEELAEALPVSGESYS